jgi:hypothetical protein
LKRTRTRTRRGGGGGGGESRKTPLKQNNDRKTARKT